MPTATPAELPTDLLRAQRRLLTWRSRQTARRPIPHSLWALAVRLVQRYGLNRTARALKLDYYSLKKRVQQSLAPVPPGQPAFVELPPVAVKQCLCEIGNRAGASMRLQLQGYVEILVQNVRPWLAISSSNLGPPSSSSVSWNMPQLQIVRLVSCARKKLRCQSEASMSVTCFLSIRGVWAKSTVKAKGSACENSANCSDSVLRAWKPGG
jgi:hypothetical protein